MHNLKLRLSTHRFTLLLTLFLLVFLTGCETVPTTNYPLPAADPIIKTSTASPDKVNLANTLYQQGKKREAANTYFAAAQDSPSPERERLMLQATEIAAMLPDERLMQQFYRSINTASLDTNNKARYNYTKALLALIKNQPKIALDLLPTNVSNISSGLANKILLTRLRAAEKTGNDFNIAVERIRQHSHLKAPKNISNNRQLIWKHLNKISKTELNLERSRSKDRNLRGWLDLIYLKDLPGGSESLNKNLANWRKNFPNHPAKPISDSLSPSTTSTASDETPVPSSIGKPIAVILPFSGRLGNVGNDLYQGIADAHKKLSPETKLLRYDTSQLDATVIYNQALQQGAEFILGPFSKQNIASIARNGYLQKPLLSLNYLPQTTSHPSNLFQIGLLPEDEALQIANFTAGKGLKRALVIVPDSTWGKRLENSFTAAYRSRGGEITKVVRYPNRASNYSHNVSELLKSAHSADMIFMAASPTQARLIYPQIVNSTLDKKPPVYATSHIYSGNSSPSLDNNLNGIIYTEIPYALATAGKSTHKYPRLYALGQDAFIISQRLSELKQGKVISGKTGKISTRSDGRLHRVLNWATFREGIPIAFTP